MAVRKEYATRNASFGRSALCESEPDLDGVVRELDLDITNRFPEVRHVDHHGELASEADSVPDEEQEFGEITTSGRAVLDVSQAPLEVLVDAHGNVNAPGAAPCGYHDSGLEIKTVSSSPKSVAATDKIPPRYPVEAWPNTR